MAMRRSSSALFGAVLALVAMLGLVAASSWHSAMVHDHVPVQVAAVDHDHDHDHAAAAEHNDHAPAKQTGGDSPVHVLAHAAGHWVAFDGPTTAKVPAIVAARAWSILTTSLASGIDPSKLLRPPRG
ncbi:hypothetical protein I6G65_01745 (plasmid) [Sphingomonas paucimobilis]|jgi:hypothetical protein|uniref:Uncharacterized protein n=2 Tax=Sphingomonas TaxID=13687 RepID=A0A7Y6B2S6_9SPHN|nr:MULTISPECIES: hypothetical protein [Sphingomonadaceae]NUU46359.1 hypothetical protein [Sphingomonas zeae]QPS14765.1 hypothetical protein I6G65_01745 [Sphingomonas paucimobilis]SMC88421.1 hypothetical protein SAMN06272759_11020 [Novosphingobium sp. B1]SUK06791.1 Uncharacterised protein [Sphingomonas paucimobilis]